MFQLITEEHFDLIRHRSKPNSHRWIQPNLYNFLRHPDDDYDIDINLWSQYCEGCAIQASLQ